MRQKILYFFFWLLSLDLFNPLLAHHTNDHLMLQGNPNQIIASTQQGVLFSWTWLIWFLLFFLMCIGVIRLWRK